MVSSFFSDREWSKHAAIGWTSSKDRIYLDNVSLSVSHADEHEAALTPSGCGVTFSAATFIDDRWMPFLRAGYADDGGALYECTVSAGLGYHRQASKDLAGIGLSMESAIGDLLRTGSVGPAHRRGLLPLAALQPPRRHPRPAVHSQSGVTPP